MGKIFYLFSLIILLSCLSDNEALVYKPDEKINDLIISIEGSILKYKFSPDKNILEETKKYLNELDKLTENNKIMEAKSLGYRAELEAIQGNEKKVRSYLNDMEKLNNKEEAIFILKAYIEKNKYEKQKIYNEGIKNANYIDRLNLFLANLLFYEFNDYSKAIVLYDETFPKLNDIYSHYYSKNRDLAKVFVKYPPQNEETKTELKKDELTFLHMINITLHESNVLTQITQDNITTTDNIFELLKKKNYFYTVYNKINIDDSVQRKDASYFIVKILSEIENDPKLLEKYNIDYNYSRHLESEKSPIKDIKPTDYFYNSVMVLIERELIDLPDGSNFSPKLNINATEFYTILKKITNF